MYEKYSLDIVPVDPRYLLKCEGVECASYQEVGYSKDIELEAIYIDEFNAVFYNEDQYWQRLRFTLAHELGHKMLSHYNTSLTFKAKEQEANKFAAELLCPSPLVFLTGITHPGDLCAAFDISASCANAIMESYDYFDPQRWHYFIEMFRRQFSQFINYRQRLNTRMRSAASIRMQLYDMW